jgi:hypothetical protein
VTIAEARPRAKHVAQGRPLTVQGRSFLDPGKVVPVGRESSYVHAGHTFGRTPDFYAQPSRYGMETLPGRFDFPRQPLFNF